MLYSTRLEVEVEDVSRTCIRRLEKCSASRIGIVERTSREGPDKWHRNFGRLCKAVKPNPQVELPQRES